MNLGKALKAPVVRCDCCNRLVSLKGLIVLPYTISDEDEIICGECEVEAFIKLEVAY